MCTKYLQTVDATFFVLIDLNMKTLISVLLIFYFTIVGLRRIEGKHYKNNIIKGLRIMEIYNENSIFKRFADSII